MWLFLKVNSRLATCIAMPELPEVETVCRGLQPYLEHKIITNFKLNRGNLRFAFPDNMEKITSGQYVQKIHRRAKYILIELANNYTLLIHLGMSGRFNISPLTDYEQQKHDHVLIQSENHVMAYNDARRFGYMDLIETPTLFEHKHLNRLGVEPLSPSFNSDYFYQTAQKRKTPVKTLLLDQRFIAGIGNIYASEALFLAKIHPETASNTLTKRQCAKLVKAVKAVLEKAILAGGSTLKDHKQPNGKSGYFQHQFQVYGKNNQPCLTCKQPLLKIVQAGRSTFFCARCQKL